MSKNNVIPIFFACDDNYVKYMLVAMKSIIENASKEYVYNMHVLHTDISEQMQKKTRCLEQENVNIYFDDVTQDLEELKEELPLRDYYSLTTYYRLFIAKRFPQYSKAIYIDSDTVTIGDISKLFETDITNYYVAAVRDQVVVQNEVFGEYAQKVLGLDRNAYFNAGMLLMNCDRFRKEDILTKFVNLLHSYMFVVAQDQDYLNIICQNKVYWLGAQWNAEIFGEPVCEEKDIQIIHYNLADKPWHNRDSRWSQYFWEYAKQTSEYEIILQECENYTQEEREKDRYSGEHLLHLALSEINNENNYLQMLRKKQGKSKERLEILEKIEQLEREGRFDVDVENDPPSTVLMPDDIEYIHKSIGSRLRTKYAYKIARWFLNTQLRKRQIIIKDVVGIENFRKLHTGAVITCNHFNAFDSFAMQVAYDKSLHRRRKMYRVIKEGNYTGFPGFYGFLMRNCNTLPLSSNFETMKKFLKAVDKLLKKGHFVLIYPEQSMWWNYRKPKPLKNGAFNFAARNNVPVLPCFITMQDSDVLDSDGFYVQEYTIHIEKPIYPDKDKSNAENIREMKNKNFEIWKNIYEAAYQIPLEYSCSEDKLGG